jgi:catechol 2,3-dioxygenase-like lactoylglutathione lyase family enzyme
MFDHIGLTVSNLERSRAFYAHALAPLGITELARFANVIGFGREHPQFWIGEGTAVQPAPRTHVAFAAVTRLEVDAFHRAALDAGGADHGAPGLRPQYHPHYYGAFVLDPDGHNIEAVCHRPA